jgi:Putative serine esterase (DUF676)
MEGLLPNSIKISADYIFSFKFVRSGHFEESEACFLMTCVPLVLLFSVLVLLTSRSSTKADAFRTTLFRRNTDAAVPSVQNAEAHSPGLFRRAFPRRNKAVGATDRNATAVNASTSSRWWEGFSPSHPFRILLPEEEDELFFNEKDADWSDEDDNNNVDDDDEDTNLVQNQSINTTTPSIVHFCFLVHGHRGHSRDLSYVQHAMRKAAGKCNGKKMKSCFIVHSATCNEKKTDDGIAAGGERLIDEMLQVIRENMEPEPGKLQDITISVLGNSLGGLYARYAVSLLQQRCRDSCKNATTINLNEQENNDTDYYILDDAFSVYCNIFCTTATPHLGISRHTFLPLPRLAEIRVAKAMGQSGHDLFRLNSLLKEMATADSFIQSLAGFRKRIAYANAFGTDFPVPASTAAFLHESSTYPHHVIETTSRGEADKPINSKTYAEDKSLVVATLHTPSKHECETARGCYDNANTPKSQSKDGIESSSHGSETDDVEIEGDDLELAQMSTSLDSLGWKKVFVDMRKEVPRISIPKAIPKVNALLRRNASGSSSVNNSEHESVDDESSSAADNSASAEAAPTSPSNAVEPIHKMKENNVVSSKDVAAAVLLTALPDEEMAFHWPMGHNMIVAFSRSRWSTYVNKAGRPVVDALARELVHDIFAFQAKPETNSDEDEIAGDRTSDE